MTLNRIAIATTFIALFATNTAFAEAPAGNVAGAVSLPSPDGKPAVVPGVMLTLTCDGGAQQSDSSDEQGRFRFSDVPAGSCTLVAELPGLAPTTAAVIVKAQETTTVALRLDLEALHESVNVTAAMPSLERDPIASHVETITSSTLEEAPLGSDRFQDALPLIPGVVRGPDGLLSINGTRSNQSAVTYNGADGSDPMTREDTVELPIDAVNSVQVRGAAFAPEFGLTGGAVTSVETRGGGSAWHASITDFEPRFRFRGGALHGFESFTPRFTTGGPLVPGKVNVMESVQYDYSQTRVYGLPPLESDTKGESVRSYSRADWTISATNHFAASALLAPRKTTYAGLSTVNPQSVTANIDNHNVFVTASDQVTVDGSGLLDVAVSVKQFDTTIGPSSGNGPMILAPDANAGSYFTVQDRRSRRVEWMTTYAFAPFGPRHLFKAGAGGAVEQIDGTSRSAPVRIVRADGTLVEQIAFVGPGVLNGQRTDLRTFVQDRWTLSPRMSVEYGGRSDYDTFTGQAGFAPRGSFTAAISEDGRTVLRGGAGVFYGVVPLNVATFEQTQDRVVTRFLADGVMPEGPAVQMPAIVESAVRMPRSVNWSVELDREWLRNLFVRARYQQRDTRFDPVVDTASDANGSAILLRPDGQSRYRGAEVTARYEFHRGDQLVMSYTRAEAVGNLNEFNNYFGNLQNPVVRADETGRLPWDAPHRYVFWGNMTLPRGFRLFPVLEVRSGFPLSVVTEDRYFVEPRNSGRYPTFVSLDAQVMKRIRFFSRHASVGVKVFNLTNHSNPREFQANLASDSFGSFSNSVGRSYRLKFIVEL